MKVFIYLTIVFISISNYTYSQKIKLPDDVESKDFVISNFSNPTVLCNKLLVTFPYRQNDGYAGALDKYFTLKAESFVRIIFNNRDSCLKLFVFPKSFEGIKITSIKYYYKNTNSIATRKIKESSVMVTSDNVGSYVDFSKIIQDSTVIIDMSFKAESKNKGNISFNLDRNIVYKDYDVQLFIPEIYSYHLEAIDNFLVSDVQRELLGPEIGYNPGTGIDGHLLPKVLADSFSNEFHTRYESVRCKENLYAIKMAPTCKELLYNSKKEIINFQLVKIDEIK